MSGGDRLGVEVHGIRLLLEADHPPLIDYARSHLGGLVVDPLTWEREAHIKVRCHWTEAAGQDPAEVDDFLGAWLDHFSLSVVEGYAR